MLSRKSRRRWWIAGSGFMVGLALAAGVLIGTAMNDHDSDRDRTEIPLHALATHGTDTMAMCTLPIAESAEGLATLDFLTGELRVFVMNNRSYTFSLIGKTNVLADLKLERGKKVNMLLVSGQTNFVRGGGTLQPAPSTLYVCDANTGAFVAYGFAYPATALAAVTPAEVLIKRLDVGLARSLNLGE
jgi:hypothetical protein